MTKSFPQCFFLFKRSGSLAVVLLTLWHRGVMGRAMFFGSVYRPPAPSSCAPRLSNYRDLCILLPPHASKQTHHSHIRTHLREQKEDQPQLLPCHQEARPASRGSEVKRSPGAAPRTLPQRGNDSRRRAFSNLLDDAGSTRPQDKEGPVLKQWPPGAVCTLFCRQGF